MAEKIEVILFDLGNVLIDFDHSIAARRIAYFCDMSAEEIYTFFFASSLTTSFEEGKISPQGFFLEVKKILNLKLSYETFVPIWNEIFFLSPQNRAVFGLANLLKRYYRVAVLTNINILHFEYLKKYFPIFDIFDYIFTSFELGAVKPDKRVYKRVLEVLQVPPGHIFYTDDRKELVESATTLGIRGLLFIGLKQLRKDLFEAGVNID
jgi:putative hydrolase of the HAD superfamily